MKFNKWTLGLAAIGVVSLASAVQAQGTGNTVLTALSSTTLSGYVDTSAHWNPGSRPSSSAYAFGGFGAKDDGFNLNVVDLKLEKPMDEGEWAAGYKVELWIGPNANNLGTANPVVTSTNGGTGAVGNFTIKQAYVSLRVPVGNGIDFKLGVWDTPIGYESLNAGDNPNYTRSWGNTIEPTEHTGLLANYRFNDVVSIAGGIANTTDGIINGRARGQSMKTYMGSISLTAPESMGFLKGATLYAGAVDGRPTGGSSPDRTFIYMGATIPTPLEGLTFGLAWDHVLFGDKAGFSTRDTDALAGYASYKVTDKLTTHIRLDYLHLGGDGSTGAGNDLITGGGAFASGDTFFATTLTLDYSLWKNVISRAEYRWDHDLGANGGRHFGQGTRDNDHLLALNVIYKF